MSTDGVENDADGSFAPDVDGDLAEDGLDNCVQVSNPSQQDTDGDDYGNVCDCDFDNDGSCGIDDFNLFLPRFAAASDDGIGTDMNSDGTVNLFDFGLFRTGYWARSPGPSGLVP